jgi:CheY-like chemotaxis protein
MENLTVLLCDDSEDVRKHLAGLLLKCNVKKVIQASDGSEVVSLLIKNFSNKGDMVNLLITDYIMPNLDGLSLVKEIKEFSNQNKDLENYVRELPIIVATAEGEINSMMSFMEAGIRTYIIKPCDKITLVEKIKLALEK